MKHMLVLACALGAMGCNDSQPTPAPTPQTVGIGWQGGDRLSMRPHVANDGAVFYVDNDWLDTEFGPCAFRVAGDGKERCLPAVPTQDGLFYVDTSCNIPAFYIQPDRCNVPTTHILVQHNSAVPCESDKWTVHTLGQTITMGSLYRTDATNGCMIAKTVSGLGGEAIVVLDSEVDPSSFVGAWVLQ